MQRGFIGLALRNQKLVELTKELTQQVGIVVAGLNQIKQEWQEKEIRKQARANRKRFPNRDPMTRQIYTELIKAAEGTTYIRVRTRMARCILAVTGIRVNELLSLKVNQLQTLIEENWIGIDRSKCGPNNHKAFLTIEFVKQIIAHQRLDTTSAYVNKLSDQERRECISHLDQMCPEKGLGFDLSPSNRWSRDIDIVRQGLRP